MARYFRQNDIDEFKECFFYHTQKGYVTQTDQLATIMRSLAFSPTKDELNKYLEAHKSKEGRIDFATFLEVMHEHYKVEKYKDEIIDSFKAQDKSGNGTVSAMEMRNILMKIGEKLPASEVDSMLREFNISPTGQVNYNEFVKAVLTPIPDY